MQQHLPTIIDIEASGFGHESYPIEIGFIRSNGERFCSLIRPADDWLFWDDRAESVHHISRHSLLESGRSIHEVADELNKILSGQTLFSDGWVVDKPWINTLFYRAKITMQFSVSPIELIMSEAQIHIWDDTKREVINELNLTRHRASNDALIIQETFRRTMAAQPKLKQNILKAAEAR